MLKKVLYASVLLFLTSNVFACGCLNPATAQMGAKQIIQKYDEQDAQLKQEFDALLQEEQNAFAWESSNAKNTKKLLLNNADILVDLKAIKSRYQKIEMYNYLESKPLKTNNKE